MASRKNLEQEDNCQIVIQGLLDPKWADWFAGMTIKPGNEWETILEGRINDQSALKGILARISDLGLALCPCSGCEAQNRQMNGMNSKDHKHLVKVERTIMMKNTKRIQIPTLLGLIGGVVVTGFTGLGVGAMLPPEIILRMMVSFGFLGFSIGVSSSQWHGAVNGLVRGILVGLIEGLASYALGFPWIIPLVFCALFGLLIEWVTSLVFKSGAVYAAG